MVRRISVLAHLGAAEAAVGRERDANYCGPHLPYDVSLKQGHPVALRGWQNGAYEQEEKRPC